MPSLEEVVNRIDKRVEDFVTEVTGEVSERLANTTPVYDGPRSEFTKNGKLTPIIKGELLGSWSVGVDGSGQPGAPTEDRTSKANDLKSQASQGSAGDVFYFTNHADYAYEVEYNITPQISDMKLKESSPRYTRNVLDRFQEILDLVVERVK